MKLRGLSESVFHLRTEVLFFAAFFRLQIEWGRARVTGGIHANLTSRTRVDLVQLH